MERTRNVRKADLILTSDWHLRDDQPVCRTDEFWKAQWNKVQQVSWLQAQHDCKVIHAGDLFHHWKASPWLLAWSIMNLPRNFYTVYGQHDLPNHNYELRHKSGVYALEAAGVVNVLDGGSWGDTAPYHPDSTFQVGVWHKFIWDGDKIPWPDCDEMTAHELLDKFPDYELIVTGDHHRPFIVEQEDGRKVVNCGCLTRQDASYDKHEPRVWLWYRKGNRIAEHFLKYDDNVISREHIEVGEQRNKRIDAFISRLNTGYKIDVSFEENLKRFISNNLMRKEIIETIYKRLEI